MKHAVFQDADSEAESLLGQWDLGGIHAAVELSGGMFLRPLRLVTDNGSFVLREHTFRASEEAFQFQFDLVNHCSDSGIACARIIPTRDGRIGVTHGETFVALHEYLKGTVHDWTAWHQIKASDPTFLARLGEAVARLHNAASKSAPGGNAPLCVQLPPIRFDALAAQREDFEGRIAAITRTPPDEAGASREAFLVLLPRLRRQWERLMNWTDRTGAAFLPQQPIHGDISAVNMVFADGVTAPGFIDWDACQRGWRLYDSLGDVLNRPPHERPDWNLFRMEEVAAYLAGYCRVADPAPNDAELRAVPLFCLARQMEDLRQRLHTITRLARDMDETNATLIRRRVEMMEQIEPFTLPA